MTPPESVSNPDVSGDAGAVEPSSLIPSIPPSFYPSFMFSPSNHESELEIIIISLFICVRACVCANYKDCLSLYICKDWKYRRSMNITRTFIFILPECTRNLPESMSLLYIIKRKQEGYSNSKNLYLQSCRASSCTTTAADHFSREQESNAVVHADC